MDSYGQDTESSKSIKSAIIRLVYGSIGFVYELIEEDRKDEPILDHEAGGGKRLKPCLHIED
jgi:hypothetical protein